MNIYGKRKIKPRGMRSLQSLRGPSDPQPPALASVSLHDLIEFPAEHPGQAEERDQHHDAEARRGIVDGRLRELTEGIAGRDNCAGPETRRDEVERKEGGPGQPRYPVGKSRKPANAMREAMKQDHPDIVTVRQANDGLHRALEPRKTKEQAGAIAPSDPEANDVAGETAEPANRDERAETQATRMRRIAREQRKQQAMRGRIAKHEAVGRIAVLAYEVEERGQIRRKQQCRPTQTRSWSVPQIGGFGLNASTPRIATKANRRARSRQLCRPSAFESEANRTARQDAYTHSGLGVRRTHKGIATTADHIWIARNRGKFILIPRVDSTQPVLFGWSGNDAG